MFLKNSNNERGATTLEYALLCSLLLLAIIPTVSKAGEHACRGFIYPGYAMFWPNSGQNPDLGDTQYPEEFAVCGGGTEGLVGGNGSYRPGEDSAPGSNSGPGSGSRPGDNTSGRPRIP